MGKIVTCTVDELALPVMGGYKSGTAVAAADGAEKELIKQFRLGIGLVEKVHIDKQVKWAGFFLFYRAVSGIKDSTPMTMACSSIVIPVCSRVQGCGVIVDNDVEIHINMKGKTI